MNTKCTLVSLFNKDREILEKKLEGFVLPKDVDNVQRTISDYLNKLLDNNGEFRQNLTQGEDYILQAALSLLNAQQEIAKTVDNKNNKIETQPSFIKVNKERNLDEKKINDIINSPVKGINALAASSGGALVGNVVLGGWGAVLGAVAGTAVAIYLTELEKQKMVSPKSNSVSKPITLTIPINIPQLMNIVCRICESVDSLVETFRTQIRRVVEKYERQEKPSFEKEHRTLLEELQSLIGYERTHDIYDEKGIRKLKERIEDIVETFENYDLTVVNYSEDVNSYFEKIPSPNTNELKMVYPAIVKNNNVVLLGKVFIPE